MTSMAEQRPQRKNPMGILYIVLGVGAAAPRRVAVGVLVLGVGTFPQLV